MKKQNAIYYTSIDDIRKAPHYYEYLFQQVKPQNRFFDIILSLILIIIFSPVMLAVQIQIYVENNSHVIYKQIRMGMHHKPIMIHKFKSMKDSNDESAKYAVTEKYRITKVGKVIRKFRLDETIQLFDVLNGKMSLIGPRPEQLQFVKEIEKIIPEYKYRYNVKPGLTGWAQVNWKYSHTMDDQKRKLEYDLYYLEHKGFKMQVIILFKSIKVMISGQGE